MSTDAQLLQAWRDGDEESGRRLLVRHFSGLCRFFRNKAGDGMEELIQRTMLVCLENAQRLRDASSFRAYLFTIARNELFRYFREGRKDLDTSLCSVHDLQPSQGTVLVKREEERILLAALRRLPLDLQVTLELYYWEGLSYAELAEVLEVHRETIKSRLRRAKQLLRTEITAAMEGAELSDASVERLDDWAQGVREGLGREPR